MSRNDGGYDTARVSAAEADRLAREERQAAALRYLSLTGETDVAIILGLVPDPEMRTRTRRGDVRRPGVLDG